MFAPLSVTTNTNASKGAQALARSPNSKQPSHASLRLQRKCACGNAASSVSEECTDCKTPKKPLQTKLTVGASADPLEHEADRIADEVVAAPAARALGVAPVQIQRFSDHSAASSQEAPASVERVLASSGRPLEPHLREDMEQRFGHDFSRVKVHADSAAQQSAEEVNARAYTVGHDIVFGAGLYSPGSPQGRRLIAHELTHVVQQRPGVEPRLRRQPAPDVDKSAQFIEDTYRSGSRQLDDPALAEAAFNVRLCRERGGVFCETLVTDDDINSKYAEWSLIESVYGSDIADKAITDHKLHEVAEGAAAQRKRTASSQPGVAVGGLVAVAPAVAPTVAPAIAPAVAPAGGGAATLPSSLWNIPAANSNVAVAGTQGATVATAAAVAAFVVFGVVVTVQLVHLSAFQRKLFAAGYKHLPSPRGVCMRGCHQGTQNLPRVTEFPDPQFLRPRAPLTPIGQHEPFSPEDFDELKDFFPRAEPRVDPRREEKKKRCEEIPRPPRGGNPEHDALAQFVTGSPVEYQVITPEGLAKQFDGKDEIDVLYDVKTRHDFLNVLGMPNAPLTRGGAWRMSSGVGKLRADAAIEQIIAVRCGYEFHIATNNLQVVEAMRELLGDIVDPDQIEFVNFPWGGAP
jgi:hypothetical protein